MSDKSLLQGEPRSALREGASRLDQFVQQVRSEQIAQRGGSTAEPRLIASPDEEWSRNFMSQGIGPRMEIPRITGFAPPPMPQMSLDAPTIRPRPERVAGPGPDAPAPMRERLGREIPRRSWVSRLFRRGT